MMNFLNTTKISTKLGLLTGLLLAAGCGGGPKADYSQITLVSVDGRITLNGAPLSDAVVTFEDQEDGTFSYGLTNSDGYYRLQLDSQTAGAKAGNKIVRISTTRKILGLNDEGESDPDAAPEGERVPDRYNKDSELTAEVSPSQKKFDFDLQGS